MRGRERIDLFNISCLIQSFSCIFNIVTEFSLYLLVFYSRSPLLRGSSLKFGGLASVSSLTPQCFYENICLFPSLTNTAIHWLASTPSVSSHFGDLDIPLISPSIILPLSFLTSLCHVEDTAFSYDFIGQNANCIIPLDHSTSVVTSLAQSAHYNGWPRGLFSCLKLLLQAMLSTLCPVALYDLTPSISLVSSPCFPASFPFTQLPASAEPDFVCRHLCPHPLSMSSG